MARVVAAVKAVCPKECLQVCDEQITGQHGADFQTFEQGEVGVPRIASKISQSTMTGQVIVAGSAAMMIETPFWKGSIDGPMACFLHNS